MEIQYQTTRHTTVKRTAKRAAADPTIKSEPESKKGMIDVFNSAPMIGFDACVPVSVALEMLAVAKKAGVTIR